MSVTGVVICTGAGRTLPSVSYRVLHVDRCHVHQTYVSPSTPSFLSQLQRVSHGCPLCRHHWYGCSLSKQLVIAARAYALSPPFCWLQCAGSNARVDPPEPLAATQRTAALRLAPVPWTAAHPSQPAGVLAAALVRLGASGSAAGVFAATGVFGGLPGPCSPRQGAGSRSTAPRSPLPCTPTTMYRGVLGSMRGQLASNP